jgi:hypothetical protein
MRLHCLVLALLLGCSQGVDDTVCLYVDDGAPCPTLAEAEVEFGGSYCGSGVPRESVLSVTAFDHRNNTVYCPGGKDMCSESIEPLDECCYQAKVKEIDGSTCGVVDTRPARADSKVALARSGRG